MSPLEHGEVFVLDVSRLWHCVTNRVMLTPNCIKDGGEVDLDLGISVNIL